MAERTKSRAGGAQITRMERDAPDVIGECVVCPAVLDAASQIQIPKAMYCCSEPCVAALRGARRVEGKGARAVARFSSWVTSTLGTELREHDLVDIVHDFSSSRNVVAGTGRVVKVEYDATLGHAIILLNMSAAVRCASGQVACIHTSC